MLSPDFLFPCFLVFPPANPSNFLHCKCFSIQIPFLFQYRSISYAFNITRSGTSTDKSSIEVQDVDWEDMQDWILLLLLLLLLLCWTIIFVSQYNSILSCMLLYYYNYRSILSVAWAGGLCLYNYTNGRYLASIHKCIAYLRMERSTRSHVTALHVLG